ncbi:uncharacterized protein LOC129321236 isoform X2 [Prosopis cineraria]|uniref:uncharacterized protein LOC129321236 isoform X2 n=1 Tax=Prosopis cineraria TaxID=364024 RepID=UPI00240F3936|nr:uncharacterized protein LOC129321236 isoform X2 [Prosopis cineraria]
MEAFITAAAFITAKLTVLLLKDLVFFKLNIDELNQEVERLSAIAGLLDYTIDSARRNGEKIDEDPHRWMNKYNDLMITVAEFMDEVWRARSKRSRYNLLTWRKLSRKARKLRQNIIEIERRGEFYCISPTFTNPPKLEYDGISTSKEVMKMLKNPYIRIIGVYGQGVSNTSLTKEVAEKAEEDKLFDVVIRAVVTRNQQIEILQNQRSEEKAGNKDRLISMLIILDDLRQELDLGEIEIPLGDAHRAVCKILLTSRDEEVLSRMVMEATLQLVRSNHTLSRACSSKIKNQPPKAISFSMETDVGTPEELERSEDLPVKPSSNIADKEPEAYEESKESSILVVEDLSEPSNIADKPPKAISFSMETDVGTLEELERSEDLPVKPSSNIADKAKVSYVEPEAYEESKESSILVVEDLSEPSNIADKPPKAISFSMETDVGTPEELERSEDLPVKPSSNIADKAKVSYVEPEAYEESNESIILVLKDLSEPSNIADKYEDSHSSVLEPNPGKPSSSVDSGKRDDITNEEREDRSLIAHSFLFPIDYEFTKEDLIRLWIAEGLFQKNQSPRNRAEDDAGVLFDSFVQREVIISSRTDPVLDFHNPNKRRLLYKFSRLAESLLSPTIFDARSVRISDVPEVVTHMCILCKSFDDTKFNAIKRFKYLRTLFLLPDHGVSFKKVPRDLFLSLKNLTSLNFSYSLLSELPSSIGYLKSLRYLDLSHTPMKELPDSIDNLQNLQTLNLRGCFNLVELPNGMSKLTKLRHLDFDVIRQLQSMPSGISNLTNLQTLSAFIVGKEKGYRIQELGSIRNLTGSFCVSRLENVLDIEDAEEAALIDKNYLTTLELRWSGKIVENINTNDEKILEHLQPTLHLQELRILDYGGSKLPTWISDPLYECLVDLSLYSFKNCQFLPSLGDLPSLQSLHITKMDELKRIDQLFCRKSSGNSQDHAFPRLEKLVFEDMPKLEEWDGVKSGDFPSLHALRLKNCPRLKSLPRLSCLSESLKHLETSYCHNIMPFLDGQENVSLETLLIKDCPKLKTCFDKSQGQDWPKIAHVPVILIDDQEISSVNC